MRRGWLMVVVAVVLVAGFGIGYAVGNDGHGADDAHGLGNDRMAMMMADGSMPAQMDDFIEMMKDLRSRMTPGMRSEMDRDAMWQLMESGQMMKMMHAHGQQMADMPGMGGNGHGTGNGNHGG